MKRLADLLPKRKPIQSPADQPTEDQIAHMYLGKMYLSLGQFAEAEAEYLRAHAISPSQECVEAIAAIRAQRATQKGSSGSLNSSRCAA
jgi:tetratricopeptide (TPR) repeat protein